MVFFKRLSRSRSNSQSYVDSYDSRHDSKTNSASYDDKYSPAGISLPADGESHQTLPGSRQSNTAPPLSELDRQTSASNMYARTSQPTEVGHGTYNSAHSSASARDTMSNGYSNAPAQNYESASSTTRKHEPAPDLLLQAFNQALRPYNDKVENLENEINDLKSYIDQLEAQQRDVHAWIDKRGLRPDVPPSIAAQMDSASQASSPTHAAVTLNAQLDRKITIVNFDLHRLQDDLNDSLPTPSFSACMLKFLPDIQRLSALPSGPRYAFDLLLKLGGNLNSHGGLENGDEEDLEERRRFYGRLDEAMVTVVHGRFREEQDSWGVQREIKRIEKTGAYLRNWGVEPYFPHTLQIMRQNSSAPAHGSTGGVPSATGGATSPPNYA